MKSIQLLCSTSTEAPRCNAVISIMLAITLASLAVTRRLDAQAVVEAGIELDLATNTADATEDNVAPVDGQRAPRGVTPDEYRGPALPIEDTGVHNLFDRAEEHFGKEEWAQGIAILDGLLSGDELSGAKSESTAESEPEKVDPANAVRGALRAIPIVRQLAGGRVFVAPAAARPAAAGNQEDSKEEKQAEDRSDPRSIVYSDDGIHYVPLIEKVRRRIEKLPEEAQQVYRQSYEPAAQQLLDAAAALPFHESLDALLEVWQRFPATPSGRQALEMLADRALDIGQSQRAAQAYRLLLRGVASSGEDAGGEARRRRASLLARRAFALLRGGRQREADRVLETLAGDFGDTVLTLGGEPVRAADLEQHELLARLLRRARPSRSDSFAWSGPKGRPDRRALSVDVEPQTILGSEAEWIHAPDVQTRARRRVVAPRDGTPLRRLNPSLAYPSFLAAARGGLVFVRSAGELVALDARSGKIRWRVDPRYGGTHAAQPASYALLGANTVSLLDGEVAIIDAQQPPRYVNRKLQFVPNRVFAYDARSGKLRWRIGGPDEATPDLQGLTFTAPPTAAGPDRLVVPATRDDAAWIIGLAASGAFRWATRLYDYNAGYLQRYRGVMSQGASLSSDGRFAVSAPGHGVVTAVEVEDGAIRWITRYRVASSAVARSTATGSWAPSQPVVVDGHVVVAPYDSDDLVVLDLEGGETLWTWQGDEGVRQLLGADSERVYIAGERLIALDLPTGEVLHESERFEHAAGRGFVTAEHVYLPLESGIAVLDVASGETVRRLGWIDERIDGLAPGNLALVPLPQGENSGGSELRLLTMGTWGYALARTQSESWRRVEARALEAPLERARLLRAEGEYEASLELVESALERARTDDSLETCRELLIETAREAAARRGRPELLERALAHARLELEPGARLEVRLELGRLLESTDPAAAWRLYRELLDGDTAALTLTVESPDGALVDPRSYVRDSLHSLGSAVQPLVPDPAWNRERESITERIERAAGASNGIERNELRSILRRFPHLPEASIALAHLLASALERNDTASALAHARRLRDGYAMAETLPRLHEIIASLSDAQRSPHVAPAEFHALPREETESWKQVFWKSVGEGVLVETGSGSDPLPCVLALKAGKLLALDENGNALGELTLPDFPDIEKAKASLKSHLEEPAVVHRRGDRAILFTAAGVYEISWNPHSDSVAPTRLGWHVTYPHSIAELYEMRPQWGWGWSTFSHVEGNLFPSFLLSRDGAEALLLKKNGSLLGIDLQTGKALFHAEPSGNIPVGEARWQNGRLVTPTETPPGLDIHRTDRLRHGAAAGPASFDRVDYPADSAALHDAHLVSETAAIFDTADAVTVVDPQTRRVPWRLGVAHGAAPIVAHATSTSVWITHPEGALECRALQSGRVSWSLPIPRRSTAIARFEGRREDASEASSVWLALASEGRSPRTFSYSSPFTQSGEAFLFLEVSSGGELLSRHELAGTGFTYDGFRVEVGDRSLLAFNVADDQRRWKTRLALWNPADGEVTPLLEHDIAGKGTGMPPRVAFVKLADDQPLALAVGNAEGYGLFRLQKQTPPADAEQTGEAPAAPPAEAPASEADDGTGEDTDNEESPARTASSDDG